MDVQDDGPARGWERSGSCAGGSQRRSRLELPRLPRHHPPAGERTVGGDEDRRAKVRPPELAQQREQLGEDSGESEAHAEQKSIGDASPPSLTFRAVARAGWWVIFHPGWPGETPCAPPAPRRPRARNRRRRSN